MQIVGDHVDLTDWHNTEPIQFNFLMPFFSPAAMMEIILR